MLYKDTNKKMMSTKHNSLRVFKSHIMHISCYMSRVVHFILLCLNRDSHDRVFLFTRRFQGTTIEIETSFRFLSDKLVRIRPPCCGRKAHCGTTRGYKRSIANNSWTGIDRRLELVREASSRVELHVVFQRVTSVEPLWTEMAGERHLSTVDQCVFL